MGITSRRAIDHSTAASAAKKNTRIVKTGNSEQVVKYIKQHMREFTPGIREYFEDKAKESRYVQLKDDEGNYNIDDEEWDSLESDDRNWKDQYWSTVNTPDGKQSRWVSLEEQDDYETTIGSEEYDEVA